MCSRPLSLQAMRKLARSSLVVLLLVLSGGYAMLGAGLFHRLGAQIHRAGHHISDATMMLRLRAAGSSLGSSNESFEQLQGHREILNQQIRAIQEQRDIAACRLREDKRLLRNILDVLAGKAVTAGVDWPRAAVEQDAAVVLGRVETHESEITKCNSLLRRMNEDLSKLEQEVEKTRCSLRQKLDALTLQKATFAAQKAYRDGLDLARDLDDGDR